jgi:hypothetical protein
MERLSIRNTQPMDFPAILTMSRRVYSGLDLWRRDQLESHLQHFPEGQFVAVDESGAIRGMAASLIVRWDDYSMSTHIGDFTESGMFTNHDPEHGHTLYGAELMIDPGFSSYDIGFQLCRARRELTQRRGLLRIRAAVPLRGYQDFTDELSPPEYLEKVLREELEDPALSFQLRWGFNVTGILGTPIPHESQSVGWSALIEWRNPAWSPYYVRTIRATRDAGYRFRTKVAAGVGFQAGRTAQPRNHGS